MISCNEARKKLLSRWERGYFFKNYRSCFPYELPLTSISSKKITDEYDAVRIWVSSYQQNTSITPFLRWKEVNHRLFGKNRVPGSLSFESPEALAGFLNRKGEWASFLRYTELLAAKDHRLAAWGERYPSRLLAVGDDLERLMSLWFWMQAHPRPGIYLRQIDLPGIDTKFTERHKRILYEWLDLTVPEESIYQEFTGLSGFERRFGYLSKPELVRFRLLDPKLFWRDCDDISIPAEQFCSLYSSDERIPIDRVFVIENDITALSFPKVERGMVIFGRGYHFDHLKGCRWLDSVDLRYWGDIDTHGFSILDQFRAIFPHTRSFLMDKKTLLDHASSWGEEARPARTGLSHLTEEEAELYEELRSDTIRKQLRLEQEFIGFKTVKEFVLKQ